MRPFEYARAGSVAEALQTIGTGARPLAGGTDLLTLMKGDLAHPDQLIDIKRAADLPRGIEETAEGVTIGALTTLTEIERHPLIRAGYPALAEAISLAATPQLRNRATIGGNLLQRPRCWYFRSSHVPCWLKGGERCYARDGENQHHAIFDVSPCVAVHPSDPAPALIALDASVTLRGRTGERTLSLDDLYAPPEQERRRETVIDDDEIITSVQLPRADQALRSTYLKAMDRAVWAFALVGVGAAVRMEGERIADTRLVLSGVAPVPCRARDAEQLLAGQAPSERLFEEAATAALADAAPLAHNGYKVPIEHALIRRALAACAGVTPGS
jgi:xanthine dehydrogenase YagS FAD-binding subunit